MAFAVFIGNYYVALNYDTTLKESFNVADGGTVEVETARQDYGITAGYEIGNGIGAFADYKTGKTVEDFVRPMEVGRRPPISMTRGRLLA